MPVPPLRGARRALALIMGAHALVLAAFSVFYLYELAVGGGSDAGGVVVSALLIALAALAVGVLARGWLGSGEWPRTPTIVWNLLLLPVGWSLVQAGRTGVGWLLVVVGVLGTLAAFATRPRLETDDSEVDSDSE